MTRKALLMGINYIGMPDQLSGCLNDINHIQNFLKSNLGFTDFLVLTDETKIKPKRENIIKAFKTFANSLKPGDVGWVHYSGHGGRLFDFNGDEVTPYDSTLIPLDHTVAGVITDDFIRKHFIEKIPTGVTVYIVIDACHSGSATDSRYTYNDSSYYNNKTSEQPLPTTYDLEEWTLRQTMTEFKKYSKTRGFVYTISGCKDDQYSADAFIEKDQLFSGALTSTLLENLNSNDLKTYKWKHMFKDLSCNLKVYGYDQQPVVSSGQPINLEDPMMLVMFNNKQKIKANTKINHSIHSANNSKKPKHMNHMNRNYGKRLLFTF